LEIDLNISLINTHTTADNLVAAFLKNAIESNNNYEVEDYHIDKFKEPISKYSLVILHQLPSIKWPLVGLIREINEAGIPLLYIIGEQTSINVFNAFKTGLEIGNSKLNASNESYPFINKNFSLFTVSNELKSLISEFSPLNSPFGIYKIQNSVSTLFNQKIGSVVSNNPLIMFNNTLDSRVGIIAGEGLWKWRIMKFLCHSFPFYRVVVLRRPAVETFSSYPLGEEGNRSFRPLTTLTVHLQGRTELIFVFSVAA